MNPAMSTAIAANVGTAPRCWVRRLTMEAFPHAEIMILSRQLRAVTCSSVGLHNQEHLAERIREDLIGLMSSHCPPI